MLRQFRRQFRVVLAASIVGAFITRMMSPEHVKKRQAKNSSATGESSRPTAQSIARDLYRQGLEQDALFEAMWAWQYDTGIEPSAIYNEYKQLREHQPEDRQQP